jgi:serine/threonine-protein kinase
VSRAAGDVLHSLALDSELEKLQTHGTPQIHRNAAIDTTIHNRGRTRLCDPLGHVVANFKTTRADARTYGCDDTPASKRVETGSQDRRHDATPTRMNCHHVAGVFVADQNGHAIGNPHPNGDSAGSRSTDDRIGLDSLATRSDDGQSSVDLSDLLDPLHAERFRDIQKRLVARRKRVREPLIGQEARLENHGDVMMSRRPMRGSTRGTSSMPAEDPFIGRDILDGTFQILQRIGSGGMGAVYKALQRDMNRMVAVKILHPKLANRSDLVARFRREARAMSQLTHPNTTKVFLYGELDDGSLYMIMEYLEGKNLNQSVRADGPFPVSRALPILVQVCGALDEAHRAGIIHRDLKPENIFLVQSAPFRDFPKVLDFGLAKVGERQMRPGSVVLTQEGMVFGTPEFMSPEQAQGKPLSPASDLYSLATILYEVLTGKLPFDAKNAMDYIQLHVTGVPIRLRERVPNKEFPPLLEQVIARALAKNPEDRFARAADFGLALQAVLEHAAALPDDIAVPPVVELPTLQMPLRPPVQPAAEPVASTDATVRDVAALVPPSYLKKPEVGAPRRHATVRGVSLRLLAGVALAFLLLGIGMALTLIRFVLD